jgi:hypothetical protein
VTTTTGWTFPWPPPTGVKEARSRIGTGWESGEQWRDRSGKFMRAAPRKPAAGELGLGRIPVTPAPGLATASLCAQEGLRRGGRRSVD